MDSIASTNKSDKHQWTRFISGKYVCMYIGQRYVPMVMKTTQVLDMFYFEILQIRATNILYIEKMNYDKVTNAKQPFNSLQFS